jgi:hypothetical protein
MGAVLCPILWEVYWQVKDHPESLWYAEEAHITQGQMEVKNAYSGEERLSKNLISFQIFEG